MSSFLMTLMTSFLMTRPISGGATLVVFVVSCFNQTIVPMCDLVHNLNKCTILFVKC